MGSDAVRRDLDALREQVAQLTEDVEAVVNHLAGVDESEPDEQSQVESDTYEGVTHD